ncbi:MAG: hypothetical protein MMC23_006204 [Stictis urceolatum]|nr:hypothetical protein [Stictis urceolata]
MERLRGVGLDNINAVDKSKALENAKDFIHQCVLPQLQQLKSRHAGGLVDHVVIPPERVRCGGSAIPGYRNHQRLLRYFPPEFESALWLQSAEERDDEDKNEDEEIDRLTKLLLDSAQKTISPQQKA